MNRLVIGSEGFVDMRRNPPPDNDRVNGWSPEQQPVKVTIPVEEPAAPVAENLPGRQTTTEGLNRPEAPVRVEATAKPKGLQRINSVDGAECYALVTMAQFEKFGSFEWTGVPSGHLFRRDMKT